MIRWRQGYGSVVNDDDDDDDHNHHHTPVLPFVPVISLEVIRDLTQLSAQESII